MRSQTDRTPVRIGRTRGRLKRRWHPVAALVAALVAVAMVALPALADVVVNSITSSTPAAFEWHGSSVVQYQVNANSTDGETGCNAKPTSPMTLSVTTPSGLVATPSSVTFTGCGLANARSITYTASAPENYSIPSSAFSAVDAGAGSYDLTRVGHSVFAYELESYLPGTPSDPYTSCTSTDPAVQPVDRFETPVCVRVYAIPGNFGSVVFDLVPPAGSGASTQSFTVAVSSARAAVRDVRPPVCGTWTTELYDATHTKLLDADTFLMTGCDAGPIVTVPDDVTLDTNVATGADVTFADATATDVFDGPLTPTCSATSGSSFPVGTTTVTCSATDFHGNTGSASFDVTVDLYQATFAAPVDGPSVMNVAKAGRVIPVKVVVRKNGTSDLTGPVSILVRGLSACDSTNVDALETYGAAGSANDGNAFRQVDGGWIYNLDTSAPGLSAGRCYRAEVYLGGAVNADGKITGGHLAGYFLIRLAR